MQCRLWCLALITILSGLVSFVARTDAADAPDSMKTVRIAGIVLKWIQGDKPANLERAEVMIREAAAGGAEIVCTTECFLDGYAIKDKSIPLEEYRALGEQIPGGHYYERLAKLADELDIRLVAGMLEADGEHRFNTAVFIGPDGSLIGKYHKHKLDHEILRNTPGDEYSVFPSPHGNVGLMICADRRVPDLVKQLCTNGADILICPSGGMFGPRSNDPIVQSRSKENGKHIVFVHPAEFLVTGPDGELVESTILGDRLGVDPEQVDSELDSRRVFYFDLPVE
ncbi:MAG: carbon-nitrogen hydrolase family protein [Planctomycetaceae bacterium]|nr:carbon-nitrogen hydrolase family protein [Planctomycetaceae bacterium]